MKGEIAFTPTKGQKLKFVIVGILGLLFIPAMILLLVFLGPGSRLGEARDTRRETDIRQIQIGLRNYYAQYGRYPFSLNELSPQYLQKMPVDPKTNLPYQYQRFSDADYQLCAQLETKKEICVSPQSF